MTCMSTSWQTLPASVQFQWRHMSVLASLITDNSNISTTVCSVKKKVKDLRLGHCDGKLATGDRCVKGIYRVTGGFPHKEPVITRKMFPRHDVIKPCACYVMSPADTSTAGGDDNVDDSDVREGEDESDERRDDEVNKLELRKMDHFYIRHTVRCRITRSVFSKFFTKDTP